MSRQVGNTIALALLVSACAQDPRTDPTEQTGDTSSDLVGQAEQASSAAYCPGTVHTGALDWYCHWFLPNGTSGEQYLGFNNNAQLPLAGAGPFTGTFTQWYPNAPRITQSYTMTLADGSFCEKEEAHTTLWNFYPANGGTCGIVIDEGLFPRPRGLLISCDTGAIVSCVEHFGPRSFGGLPNQ